MFTFQEHQYRKKSKILLNQTILVCKVELHLHFIFDQLNHYSNGLKWILVQKIDAKKCPMESFLIYFSQNSKYDRLLFQININVAEAFF